jgi:inner membrane protein
MHIPTHLMLSWVVGHRLQERRDRRLVAWAGVAADFDGLSILAGLDSYGRWHHTLTHGFLAGLIITGFCTYCAKDRPRVWCLGLAAFHLHLLCDWLGSGIDWPIQYFWPVSDIFYSTPYGWELDGWQNWLVTVVLLFICARLAITSGRSLAETFLPATADAAVVAALRQRFRPQLAEYGSPAA